MAIVVFELLLVVVGAIVYFSVKAKRTKVPHRSCGGEGDFASAKTIFLLFLKVYCSLAV